MKITKAEKKQVEYLSRFIAYILFMIVGTLIITEIVAPGLIALVNIFMTLIIIYPLLNLETKFIGGCFFLVIFFYITIFIFTWGIKFLEFGLGNFMKLLKNEKK